MSQGTWSVDDTERETEHSFVVDSDKPLELSVSNVHGCTFVRGADRDDVLVHSTKHGRQDTKAYERARLQIEAEGNVIRVHPDYGVRSVSGDAKNFDIDLDLSMDLGRDIVRDVVGGMFGKRSGSTRERDRGDRQDRTDRKDQSGRPRYDLVIEVPKALATGSRVNVRTASGPATCADLACRVEASSASSDWHLRAIAGPLTVQTASGDIVIEGIDGSLTLRSASGDARVTGAKLSNLNVNTASGDISVAGRLNGSESCRIHTVSGEVNLELAAPLPSAIEFKSVSGDAFIGAPYEHTGRKTWQINGEDGAELAVKTVSGDLHLRAGDLPSAGITESRIPEAMVPPSPAAPPAASSPPAPAAAPAAGAIPLSGPTANGEAHMADRQAGLNEAEETERLDLLQALERGEIDVEDAMRRLDELDAGGDAPPS
jgi:hypothetical protein